MGNQALLLDRERDHIHVQLEGPEGHLLIDGPRLLLAKFLDTFAVCAHLHDPQPLGEEAAHGATDDGAAGTS